MQLCSLWDSSLSFIRCLEKLDPGSVSVRYFIVTFPRRLDLLFGSVVPLSVKYSILVFTLMVVLNTTNSRGFRNFKVMLFWIMGTLVKQLSSHYFYHSSEGYTIKKITNVACFWFINWLAIHLPKWPQLASRPTCWHVLPMEALVGTHHCTSHRQSD
jgi:hypothetical protein